LKIYKKLAGQTIVYGLATVIPRILNYSILTVYYTRLFSVPDFGVLTELYAYITFLLIILTYGMETGYFRFAIGDKNKSAYSSIIISVFTTSVLFLFICYYLRFHIAEILEYKGYEEYITMLAAIVAIDAFSSIPFARLRKEERSIKFAFLKIINIILTIICVLFFYEILPSLINRSSFYLFIDIRSDVTYVLLSNLIASFVVLMLLLPELLEAKLVINWKLLKSILAYSLPLLIAGLGGTVSESLDRILLKYLIPDHNTAIYALGIYGANYRIAVLLLIFIQMFRFAIEPFFFNYYGQKDDKVIFAQIMRLYIGVVLIISLMLLLYLKYFKYFIDSKFHEGLNIVPIIVISYILYGIFYNLSIWYKLTKKTMYGAILTINGAIVTIIINFLFVGKFSYIAAAYGHLVAYFITVVLSYYWGNKYYKIDYNLRRIGEYFLIAIIIFVLGNRILNDNFITDLINGILIIGFSIYIIHREKLLNITKFINAS
jgi:O-antigen/teichoic acid export membrane protein